MPGGGLLGGGVVAAQSVPEGKGEDRARDGQALWAGDCDLHRPVFVQPDRCTGGGHGGIRPQGDVGRYGGVLFRVRQPTSLTPFP